MKKNSLVRIIYLYLFTCLGLALLTIGGVRFVNMGLKTFIFTKADQTQQMYKTQPPFLNYSPIKQAEEFQTKEGLTEKEKAFIRQWIEDYKAWKEEAANFDYLASKRQRDASLNLALILVGLPLYLYHWGIIAKETKEEKEEKEKA
jgi:hypothetical protein